MNKTLWIKENKPAVNESSRCIQWMVTITLTLVFANHHQSAFSVRSVYNFGPTSNKKDTNDNGVSSIVTINFAKKLNNMDVASCIVIL